MELKDCTSENTQKLEVQNVEVLAKVLSVYDGDTITCAADFFGCGKFFQHNVRFLGMNAPEIRTRRKKEKGFGIEAGDYLRKLIEGKYVTLVIKDNNDKYGRTSAIVMLGELNICDHMVELGYARTYSGGSRDPWFSDKDESSWAATS
jgi:endonuclease YncB( thermonuclease family)